MPAGWSLGPIGPALEVIREHRDPVVRRALGFEKAGAQGLALWEDGRLVAAAHFHGYGVYGGSDWRIGERDAVLVNIVTLPGFRGRGAAPLLIAAGAHQLAERGVRRFFATIWWTNRASLRAFRKVGWRVVGLTARMRPFGRQMALRLPLG